MGNWGENHENVKWPLQNSLQIDSSSTISLEAISKVILTIGDYDVFYVFFFLEKPTPKHLLAGFFVASRGETPSSRVALCRGETPVKGRFWLGEIFGRMWVFPKIMVSPNHPWINRVFHYFHHPFFGVPLFLETPMFPNHIPTNINWCKISSINSMFGLCYP